MSGAEEDWEAGAANWEKIVVVEGDFELDPKLGLVLVNFEPVEVKLE